MDKVEYSLQVPKEAKEVIDAVIGLTMHFVNKKPVEEIAALLPEIVRAVEGADKVWDEVRSEGKDELALYMLHRIYGIFE